MSNGIKDITQILPPGAKLAVPEIAYAPVTTYVKKRGPATISFDRSAMLSYTGSQLLGMLNGSLPLPEGK